MYEKASEEWNTFLLKKLAPASWRRCGRTSTRTLLQPDSVWTGKRFFHQLTHDGQDPPWEQTSVSAIEMFPSVVHNVLMVGPPGSGKTLLARAMPGILPRMSIKEALDVTRIYSVAD